MGSEFLESAAVLGAVLHSLFVDILYLYEVYYVERIEFVENGPL